MGITMMDKEGDEVMNRRELLDNLEELDLTENQLRKYVHLGLLKTKRISSGLRKAGSIYPGDSIEIIKDIKKLQTSHSLKDILFILYFKGYEIDLEKLKQQLQTCYFNVLNDFSSLAGRCFEISSRFRSSILLICYSC
jgi:DNA-binding transcriptional MerR regulator